MVWIGAHPDMNTPDPTPSGNVHGMPLACCIGRGPAELTRIFGYSPKIDPANVALVRVRSVDDKERDNLERPGVHVFTMRDIDQHGMRPVIEQSIRLAGAGTTAFHVSL